MVLRLKTSPRNETLMDYYLLIYNPTRVSVIYAKPIVYVVVCKFLFVTKARVVFSMCIRPVRYLKVKSNILQGSNA